MQRQTQLANDIWPLLLPRIQAMITAAASGSGSGSGGTAVNLAAHDLAGSLHRGTLRNDQAPQFLLTDGTRSLAGSLAVDAGVTVDGVDISAHAADINAHHAKLHGITDAANHSATGSQYQIVGLTAVNTLGLLTPSASPAANAIIKTDGSSAVTLVDLTVTSDLFMSGYLDFGTDVMYEDASYLQVTGSKPVRFGQNIGNAAWTIYNAGGADFNGTVKIMSGGDFFVSGSGAYSGNDVIHASAVGGNVGILCVADSQFALDVNGPARATYFIGPHAIQLKNVVLLSHFDGRAPYNTNFSGEPNGHMGQVATVAGGLIYRPGKFYKAVQVAQSAYNFCPNPRSELDASGWTQQYNAGTLTSQARLAVTDAPYGGYAVVMTASALSNYVFNAPHFHAPASVTMTWNIGETATLSCYVWGSGTWRIVFEDAGQNLNAYKDVTLSASQEWQRVFITATNGTAANQASVRLSFFPRSAGGTLAVNGVQYENIGRATPYIDGSLGGEAGGHGWFGTAHASYSYRNAGQLSYAQSMPTQWTVMFWAYRAAWQTGVIGYELGWGSGSIYYNASNQDVVGPITSTAPADGWHHYCIIYDTAGITRAYRDGIYLGQSSAAITTAATMYVGWNGAGAYCNSWIDDLCLLDRALSVAADNSCSELQAVYASNAPVFAETSTFSFRPTPKGLIWADDEGLWMRDTAGKPVLGVYGGEAATKNWGGFNLVPGDLLLGNNAVGSSAIWWSRVSGKFGFYGAGSGTPQVEIATDGKLTAGAGKVSLDSTGFKAYNASAVETININANGIYMGDGGARTTIASWTSGNRLQWYSVGETYEATPEAYLDDSSISRTLYPLVIRAVRQGNDAALIELAAVRSDTGAGAKIIIGEGFRLKGYFSGSGNSYATNRVVHAIADDVILEATNLQWLGMTTSTSAVGTYAGKIKIRINGTDRYIPYYAS